MAQIIVFSLFYSVLIEIRGQFDNVLWGVLKLKQKSVMNGQIYGLAILCPFQQFFSHIKMQEGEGDEV